MLLGAIAYDFTGATDLCSMLVRGGMRTVQLLGVPTDKDSVPDADAVVVALKSRTAPVGEAVGDSLAALAWLQQAAPAGGAVLPPGDPAMAPAIAAAARDARAVLLANHGPVVSGGTLTDAVYAAEELEEAAKLFLILRGAAPADAGANGRSAGDVRLTAADSVESGALASGGQ